MRGRLYARCVSVVYNVKKNRQRHVLNHAKCVDDKMRVS